MKQKQQKLFRIQQLKYALAAFLLIIFSSGAYAVTIPAATEAAFDAALSSYVAGDIISLTNNIVVTSEKIISKSITINGNGYTMSVPNPGLDDMGRFNSVTPSAFRVFTVSTSYTVTMNNLTIKGGLVNGDFGGAIYVYGTLHLNSCVVSNSRAVYTDTNYGGAGGIYNTLGGIVYLNNSLINRNAALYGGGFMNKGTMYIENSTFSENRSTFTGGGGGAGENKGTIYMNNSTLSNNQSTEIGGGINNNGGIIYVTNSSFTGNVAYGTYSGGGIGNNGGSVYAINTLFAHNYHRTGGSVSSPTVYILDDIVANVSQSNVALYYCIFHATLPSGTNSVIGNTQYTGLQDGSNNTIFSGGASAKITDGTGTEIGTASVYRPFLYNNAGLVAPTIKISSYLLDVAHKGTQTRFENNNNVSPAVAYYNKTSSIWVNLTGTSTSGQLISVDQISAARANPPVVGAIETATVENLYFLRVNSATNGTVNGGTFYGDPYKSGTQVTITALPYNGYHFVEWDYVGGIGGTGIASTSNPYTVTMNKDITIVPVYAVNGSSSYQITYVGNNNTSGTAPATAAYSAATTILSTGDLVRTGYTIAGWNTNANGSGTDYAVGSTYSLGVNLTLYAKWTTIPVVTADAATNIRLTTATIGATITPSDAVVTERGICWSYTSGVTISNNKTVVAGTTGGSFTANLTGLNRSTTIYYKGYYIAAGNTVLSVENSFSNVPVFTGTGNWEDPSRWNVQEIPGALVAGMFNPDSPTINGNCTINSNVGGNIITINSGKNLTVSKGVVLYVEGQLNNNAGNSGLLIKAGDASTGNGNLFFMYPLLNQSVSATVEMYSKASISSGQNHWQYFGIPVQGQTVGTTFGGGTERVRRYNEANHDASGYDRGLWYPYPSSTMSAGESMTPVTGYEVVQSAPKTYTFKGYLNTIDVNRTLAYTQGADYAGQNILSNPFTFGVVITKLTFGSQTEAAVYMYNTGSYEEWTAGIGNNTGSDPGTYIVSTPSTAGQLGVPGIIPSMQGFLVNALSNSVDATFTMTSSFGDFNTPQLAKATTSLSVATRINIVGNKNSDCMWIFENPSCSTAFDNGWDGKKILASTTQLFAMEVDQNYQIDAVKDINETYLGFQSGTDTDFKISFTHQNVDSKYAGLYLVDMIDNKIIDITASGTEYAFTATPSTTPVKRFKIVSTTTGVTTPNAASALKVFSSQGSIFVQNNSDKAGTITLYTMSGVAVRSVAFSGNGLTTLSNIAQGAYIVKAKTSAEEIITHLIIR